MKTNCIQRATELLDQTHCSVYELSENCWNGNFNTLYEINVEVLKIRTEILKGHDLRYTRLLVFK